MNKDKDKLKETKGDENNMENAIKRPCTVLESLEESLKEMQFNRKNNIKGKTWAEFKEELKQEKEGK